MKTLINVVFVIVLFFTYKANTRVFRHNIGGLVSSLMGMQNLDEDKCSDLLSEKSLQKLNTDPIGLYNDLVLDFCYSEEFDISSEVKPFACLTISLFILQNAKLALINNDYDTFENTVAKRFCSESDTYYKSLCNFAEELVNQPPEDLETICESEHKELEGEWDWLGVKATELDDETFCDVELYLIDELSLIDSLTDTRLCKLSYVLGNYFKVNERASEVHQALQNLSVATSAELNEHCLDLVTNTSALVLLTTEQLQHLCEETVREAETECSVNPDCDVALFAVTYIFDTYSAVFEEYTYTAFPEMDKMLPADELDAVYRATNRIVTGEEPETEESYEELQQHALG